MSLLLNKFLKPKELTLANGKVVIEPRTPTLLITVVIIITSYFAIELTGFSFATLFNRGSEFFVLLDNMFFQPAPNTNFIATAMEPLLDTIKMSLLGTFLGAALSLPVAILASTNIVKSNIIVVIARFIFSFIRTLPTLVIALIASFVIGIGTVAGTVAITLFTFGFVGKLLYEQIETVDMGAYEAMEAMGSNKTRSFLVAIIPQIMPRFLSNSLFCFEGNVRHAAILGMVGAGGIGLLFNTQLAFRHYSNIGMILVMMYITVFIIEMLSKYIRKKLV